MTHYLYREWMRPVILDSPTTTPNPIDSLPPTDERVGMPTVGDASYCVPCDFYEVIRRDMIDDDGAVACRWCGSFDLSGHGVASLRGVRHGT
jgi:hypothetical protein